MQFDWPILSALIWLPIAGGVALLALGDRAANLGRWLALVVTVLTFILSIQLYTGFVTTTADMQFVERLPWIQSFNAWYYLGLDGISRIVDVNAVKRHVDRCRSRSGPGDIHRVTNLGRICLAAAPDQ